MRTSTALLKEIISQSTKSRSSRHLSSFLTHSVVIRSNWTSFGQSSLRFFTTGRRKNNEIMPDIIKMAAQEEEKLSQVGFSKKYIGIRQRFLRNFYYNGYVASEIKTSDNSQNRDKITYVKFSDQTIYASLALINFACESHLLSLYKLDNRLSEYLIDNILSAMLYDESNGAGRLDINGRDIYLGNKTTTSGFLIRDSIYDEWDRKIMKIPPGAELHSDFISDVTFKNGDAAPSQDQLAHALVGLWAVLIYSKSQRSKDDARRLAVKIIDFLINNDFIIYYPNRKNGKIAVPRGPDARLMSSFLNIISNKIGGPSFYRKTVPGLDLIFNVIAINCFSEITIEVEEIQTLTQDVFNDTDKFVESLLKQLGRYNPCRNPIKKAAQGVVREARKRYENAKSYEANLMLLAAAFHSEVELSDFIAKSLKYCNNHVWAPLLKGIVEKKHLSLPEIDNELEACPEEGPNNIRKSSWWKDNRWIRTKDVKDTFEKGDLQYNGLDYLNVEAMMKLNATFFKPTQDISKSKELPYLQERVTPKLS